MKTLLYISLIGLLLGVGACKKKDKCEDVNCGTNGQCVDGVCICINGYVGAKCDTALSLCQQNHTGSIRIINNGSYYYSVNANQGTAPLFVDTGNQGLINVYSGNVHLTIVSSTCCVPGTYPCQYCNTILDSVIVNDCQESTYIIH